MFAREIRKFSVGILAVFMTACSHSKTTLPVQPPAAAPTATPSPTPTSQPKTNADLGKMLLQNSEDENLRRWTKEDIRRAEDQLVKIEERIKQNPDPNQTGFMQLMAQRLRQSIVRAKELQKESQATAK